MASANEIRQLEEKLAVLLRKQNDFVDLIKQLKQDIEGLKTSAEIQTEVFPSKTEDKEAVVVSKPVFAEEQPILSEVEKKSWSFDDKFSNPVSSEAQPTPKPWTLSNKTSTPAEKSDWERFIGQNLLSKIGILVTIIGIFIGVKYSIENNLISPLVRIALGYIAGLGLLGAGIYLKKKYNDFSAVLVSGALTTFYFITYIAYDFHGLFPQIVAFALMFIFTAFTVFTALKYNQQIIAVLGLVGSYAVPFLLSDGSGDVLTLFSYTAIINLGILIISFYKSWRTLPVLAFISTWVIYLTMRVFYFEDEKLLIYLTFHIIFFLLFFGAFLGRKAVQKFELKISDTILILINSLIFYSIGVSFEYSFPDTSHYLGFYTLAVAVFHVLVAVFLYNRKQVSKGVKYLNLILALTFITLVIPMEFEGVWITLFWGIEAMLLFWIGRTKKLPVFEYIAYPVVALGFLSLVFLWEDHTISRYYWVKENLATQTPFANGIFISGLVFALALGFISYFNQRDKKEANTIRKIVAVVINAMLILTVYVTFFKEISNYWMIQLHTTEIPVEGEGYMDKNWDLMDFRSVWLVIYGLIFVSVLAWVNLLKIKNRTFGFVTIVLLFIFSAEFLTVGLLYISDLRESYVSTAESLFDKESMYITIRYIALAVFAFCLWTFYQVVHTTDWVDKTKRWIFEILLHLAILWALSSELLHWMDMLSDKNSYKLALSIFWGVYAVFLVALGLYARKRYLRISGIVLFSVTLLKLFFYDIIHLSTIAKTIVFVALGLLLLLISFFYNKYTSRINEQE